MSGGMSLVSSYSAAHSDSEEELEPQESLTGNISDEDEHRSPAVIPRKRPAAENYSPVVKDSDSSDRQQPKRLGLVSYADPDDDEEDEEEGDESSGDGYFVHNRQRDDTTRHVDTDVQLSNETVLSSDQTTSLPRGIQSVAAGSSELPPEPKGSCSPTLQRKIATMYEKVRKGMDMNWEIQKKKAFRNPSIYEKLIDYINIDEKGTNYPPEIYNPTLWSKDSFYDELARVQKVEMDKREKERKERTKVEFVIGTKVTPSSISEAEKRRTKWDSSSAPPVTVSATSTAPTVLSSSVPSTSGTTAKSTVIPATGSLSKKKM